MGQFLDRRIDGQFAILQSIYISRFMTVLSFLINAEEPCFCQNGGYFDGNKCVCCGDFTGPYCEEYEGTGEYRHPAVTLHADANNDIHCLHT